MIESAPPSLLKGWRHSFRGSFYRHRNGWTAIVVVDDDGYTLILRRTERTFEDALAIANDVLTTEETKP